MPLGTVPLKLTVLPNVLYPNQIKYNGSYFNPSETNHRLYLRSSTSPSILLYFFSSLF